MTQEAIAVSTTPPLPGLQMVQQVNAALQTIATGFAGPDDPAALAGPYMTWADTGTMLLKRRNAANSVWEVEGPLLSYGSPELTFEAAPSVAPDDVVVQSQVFGVDQTLQDVTSSRVIATSYLNTTGKPIVIYVKGITTAAGQYLTGWIGENPYVRSESSVSGQTIGVSLVVPPGWDCRVSGTTSISLWVEYRS